jgi:transposase
LDQLLTLYRDAKRTAADGRLGEEERKRRANDFELRLFHLCFPHRQDVTPDMTPHQREFANFIEEMLRLWEAEELFTFVWAKGVDPTNNTSERKLRNPALDRKASRTNKTAKGAHRRSVVVSVLESLRTNLGKFTLQTVLDEVTRWMSEGISLFAKQWKKIKEAQEAQPVPAPNTG